MYSLLSYKTISYGKTLITLITCEWLSQVCTFWWFISVALSVKNLSTLITWKWFLPSMYSLLSYKTISYGKHSYLINHMWMAFPQCLLSGIRINLILRVNLFSQSLQWKGLSSVWTIWCWNRFDCLLIFYSQILHWKCFSTIWRFWFLIRHILLVKLFSQPLQ